MTRISTLVFAIGAAAFAGAPAYAGPPPGRLPAAQCAQCHGTNGYSVSGIDGLAGNEAKDLYDKLVDMRDGDDRGIMHLQARGYTDAQLRLIAEYFASLPENPGEN